MLAGIPGTSVVAGAFGLAVVSLLLFCLGAVWRRHLILRERRSRKGPYLMANSTFDDPLPEAASPAQAHSQVHAVTEAHARAGRAQELDLLRHLRRQRRKYIDETFEALDFAFESTGGFMPRWRHREFQEQIRMDIVLLRELVEHLRALKDEAEDSSE
jgi:hypothetical protein